MINFIKFLCAHLIFVPINRIWKSHKNCPMKLPSCSLSLIIKVGLFVLFLEFMIKDRNGKDLTEAIEIKKRWQEYTGQLTR